MKFFKKKLAIMVFCFMFTTPLLACGRTNHESITYTTIQWRVLNTQSRKGDGGLNLKEGYYINDCSVDYDNNQVIMKIEKR